MGVKLLPTLVETVDGKKERLGVGDVDRHRHLQGSRRLPHRIEPRIVDPPQLAPALLAHTHAFACRQHARLLPNLSQFSGTDSSPWPYRPCALRLLRCAVAGKK